MALPIPSISCFVPQQLFFCKEKKVLDLNWDRCCHLALCLWLILFHWIISLDGITNPKYKLLRSSTTIFFKEKKAIGFKRDSCCHLALCIWLILFHWMISFCCWRSPSFCFLPKINFKNSASFLKCHIFIVSFVACTINILQSSIDDRHIYCTINIINEYKWHL